jgi:hypothetical protein
MSKASEIFRKNLIALFEVMAERAREKGEPLTEAELVKRLPAHPPLSMRRRKARRAEALRALAGKGESDG